jgi:TPR repeat protein
MAHIEDSNKSPARAAALAILFACALLPSGCSMHDQANESLPRFTKLEPFHPHRSEFECKYESAVNPPITPEADALFQQALALGSFEIWPDKRDYTKIATLYEQAMKLGHWKAQFNLAGAYLKGAGVPQDVEKAIQLTEDLMRRGVPAAWDNMGAYYMGGIGDLKQDATVAYAFWQKAADMGSMAAQTYLGEKLTANHDEPPSFWGNRPIGLKMLECAFTQGSAQAAFELGLTIGNTDHEYDRALKVLHEGVKRGSEDSANSLFVAFDDGKSLVNNLKDKSRAVRYKTLADALFRNPDLRFPNLDKVLPLPPVRLPTWDGKKGSLIDAAKAVVPVPPPSPKPEPNPTSQKTSRADIPDGWTLPIQSQKTVQAQFEGSTVPESGYWIPRLMQHTHPRHIVWDEEQVPVRYGKSEHFETSRIGLQPEDGLIQFHYLGELVTGQPASDLLREHPRVARGIACYSDIPIQPRQCTGNKACPRTGIWMASLPKDHPMSAAFNQWYQQAYIENGQSFPALDAQHLNIDSGQITWQWWGQANGWRGENTYISMDALRGKT